MVFLLVPGASTVVRAVVGRALGEDEVPPLGLAPPGQSTADYLILLAVFGSALVVARTAYRDQRRWGRRSGRIWSSSP